MALGITTVVFNELLKFLELNEKTVFLKTLLYVVYIYLSIDKKQNIASMILVFDGQEIVGTDILKKGIIISGT